MHLGMYLKRRAKALYLFKLFRVSVGHLSTPTAVCIWRRARAPTPQIVTMLASLHPTGLERKISSKPIVWMRPPSAILWEEARASWRSRISLTFGNCGMAMAPTMLVALFLLLWVLA